MVAGALSAEPLGVEVASKQGLLMNADTGVVLFEKKGFEKGYPASTTKIATVALALKHLEGHLANRKGRKVYSLDICTRRNRCL